MRLVVLKNWDYLAKETAFAVSESDFFLAGFVAGNVALKIVKTAGSLIYKVLWPL